MNVDKRSQVKCKLCLSLFMFEIYGNMTLQIHHIFEIALQSRNFVANFNISGYINCKKLKR